MNNLDNKIKSIDGQSLRLKNDIMTMIADSKSVEEIKEIMNYVNKKINNNPNVSQIAEDIYDYADMCISKMNRPAKHNKNNKFKKTKPLEPNQYVEKCLVLEQTLGELINSDDKDSYDNKDFVDMKEKFEKMKSDLLLNSNSIDNYEELYNRVESDIEMLDAYIDIIDNIDKINNVFKK